MGLRSNAAAVGDEARDRDGAFLALDFDGGERGEFEAVAEASGHAFGDEDFAGSGGGHEPGGEVHVVTEHAVRAAACTAVGTGAHRAAGDADTGVVDAGGDLRRRLDDRECGGESASGVVFVGDGCAECGVEVAAFVADRDLEDVTVEVTDNALSPAEVGVEFLRGVGVFFERDAAETDEHRRGRPQLGEKDVLPGDDAGVDIVEHPSAHAGIGLGRERDGEARCAGRDGVDRLDDGYARRSVGGSGRVPLVHP
jgi:hypothetical protein